MLRALSIFTPRLRVKRSFFLSYLEQIATERSDRQGLSRVNVESTSRASGLMTVGATVKSIRVPYSFTFLNPFIFSNSKRAADVKTRM